MKVFEHTLPDGRVLVGWHSDSQSPELEATLWASMNEFKYEVEGPLSEITESRAQELGFDHKWQIRHLINRETNIWRDSGRDYDKFIKAVNNILLILTEE